MKYTKTVGQLAYVLEGTPDEVKEMLVFLGEVDKNEPKSGVANADTYFPYVENPPPNLDYCSPISEIDENELFKHEKDIKMGGSGKAPISEYKFNVSVEPKEISEERLKEIVNRLFEEFYEVLVEKFDSNGSPV